MKFEYDETTEDQECVAYLHTMSYGGDVDTTSLAVKTWDGKVITFYHDGDIKEQKCYEDGLGHNLIKKFYPGDKVTITF